MKVRGEETSSAQRREFETTQIVGAKRDRRCATLRDRGFTQFVTNYLSRRKSSGCEKQLTLSLFPGYLFRRFKLSDLFAILNRIGVIPVEGAGNKPLAVGEAAVCNCRRVIEQVVRLRAVAVRYGFHYHSAAFQSNCSADGLQRLRHLQV
jgi:hypothetical protein